MYCIQKTFTRLKYIGPKCDPWGTYDVTQISRNRKSPIFKQCLLSIASMHFEIISIRFSTYLQNKDVLLLNIYFTFLLTKNYRSIRFYSQYNFYFITLAFVETFFKCSVHREDLNNRSSIDIVRVSKDSSKRNHRRHARYG